MTYLPTLLTLTGVLILSVISPGPNFVLVTSTAIGVSRRAGLLTALGLAAATASWVLLAEAGLGFVIVRVGWLYTGVKLAGAAYLIWLGARILIGARKPAKTAMVVAQPASALATVRKAYSVSMTSPKSAAYYGSLFAVMVPAHAPLWLYGFVLAIAAAISSLWYGALALVLSHGAVRAWFLKIRAGFEAVMGVVLIGMGGRMLFSR